MSNKNKIRYAMSRGRRNGIVVFVLLLGAGLVWLDRGPGKELRKVILQPAPKIDDVAKYHLKSFTVTKIVDGDTLDINIGDGKYDHTRIRLLGIDTPETESDVYPAMYYGPEASEFAKQLAMGGEVTVIIDTVADVRDKYDRLLAYIELADGTVLNEELLRGGFGYADLRFSHSEFDKYVDLQDTAIKTRAGLWKGVTIKQLPKWLQRERPRILEEQKH